MYRYCPVVRIYQIDKHPDADRLQLIKFKVDGTWLQLVTGIHYALNQYGIFIPLGAVVPDKLAEEMELLGKLGGYNKNVVEALQKRGIWSNGLFYGQEGPSFNPKWQEGQDVTEEIGVSFDESRVAVPDLSSGN